MCYSIALPSSIISSIRERITQLKYEPVMDLVFNRMRSQVILSNLYMEQQNSLPATKITRSYSYVPRTEKWKGTQTIGLIYTVTNYTRKTPTTSSSCKITELVQNHILTWRSTTSIRTLPSSSKCPTALKVWPLIWSASFSLEVIYPGRVSSTSTSTVPTSLNAPVSSSNTTYAVEALIKIASSYYHHVTTKPKHTHTHSNSCHEISRKTFFKTYYNLLNSYDRSNITSTYNIISINFVMHQLQYIMMRVKKFVKPDYNFSICHRWIIS